jgi:cell division protein FtsI (penicillin-binding protein 3)
MGSRAARPQQTTWRELATVGLVITGGLLLGLRVLHVDFYLAPRFSTVVFQQRLVVEEVPPRLGDILDRHGRVLATSVPLYSLFANPRAADAERLDEWCRGLGQALHTNPVALKEVILSRKDRYFVWLKRRLTEEELQAVRSLGLPDGVFGFRQEYRRVYPKGALAAHVLGFRDVDLQPHGGVEQQWDRVLRGRPGRRLVWRDATGRPVVHREQQAAVPGAAVILTLDAVIQRLTERLLEEAVHQARPRGGGAAVVLEPHTGEILALASWPAFDPNQPQAALPDVWLNRVVGAVYEPGSTFKPFVVAAALNWELAKPGELINCHQGVYVMGDRVLHSHRPHGVLSLAEVLVRSDNIGMAILGERLGLEGLFKAVELFGFGRKTGVGLPEEVDGRVLPFRFWNRYSVGSIPMGHEIGVTPLQLATAFGALANGGWLLRPTLVREIRWTDEPGKIQQSGAVVVRQVVRREVARYLVEEVLRAVVEDPKGTGTLAQLKGYSLFGKTGTAQKPDPAGGYSRQHHVSSFVAGAPVPAPRVVALMLLDDPAVEGSHYGGKLVAPYVARLLDVVLRYQGVAPDRSSAGAASGGGNGLTWSPSDQLF